MKYNKSYWIGWLQGFADGEAHIDTYIPEIIISNTVRPLLEHCQQGLTYLGIYSRLLGPYQHTNPKYKPMYRLRIQRRQAIRDWARLIGFQDPIKQTKLQESLNRMTPYQSTP